MSMLTSFRNAGVHARRPPGGPRQRSARRRGPPHAPPRRDPHPDTPFPPRGPHQPPAPAPRQRDAAPPMQVAGADLVAGHSAHVFHGVAWPDGGPVLFDLGDALDDYAVDGVLRNDLGVMALWRPGEAELELVGLALDYCRTRLADREDAEWIAARLERACGELGTRVERTGTQRFVVRPL